MANFNQAATVPTKLSIAIPAITVVRSAENANLYQVVSFYTQLWRIDTSVVALAVVGQIWPFGILPQ